MLAGEIAVAIQTLYDREKYFTLNTQVKQAETRYILNHL